MYILGDPDCSSLWRVHQLPNSRQTPESEKNMDRVEHAQLQEEKRVGQICDVNVLVDYHTHHNRVRRLACGEPSGDAV